MAYYGVVPEYIKEYETFLFFSIELIKIIKLYISCFVMPFYGVYVFEAPKSASIIKSIRKDG